MKLNRIFQSIIIVAIILVSIPQRVDATEKRSQKLNWSILTEPQHFHQPEEIGPNPNKVRVKDKREITRTPASKRLGAIPAVPARSNLNIYTMCSTRIGNTVNMDQRLSFEDCLARPDNPRSLVISNEKLPFDFQFLIR